MEYTGYERHDGRSISLAGCKYSWDDFDVDAKKLGFTRSQFFQYLYTSWKEKMRRQRIYDNLVILLLFSIFFMMLLLIWGVM